MVKSKKVSFLLAALVGFSLLGQSPANASLPTISNVSPVDGSVSGNELVTLTGANLSTASSVQIGSEALTKVADDTPSGSLSSGQWSYQSSNQKIIFKTPVRSGTGLTVGVQQITVTNPNGTSTDVASFTYRPRFQSNPSTARVVLGDLASRSKGKPITRSTTSPYNVSGTDSLSGGAYSYVTDYNYASLFSSHNAYYRESVEVTAQSGFNGTIDTSSATEVVLNSSVTCTHTNTSPNGSGTVTNGSTSAYCSIFGPEIYSEAFYATTSQSLSFDWKAVGGGDHYEVYAFLVSVNDTSTIPTPSSSNNKILVHSMGSSLSNFVTSAATIPADGLYRFRFVNGSYDASGGKALGANMYIKKSVTIGDANSISFPNLSDQVLTNSAYPDFSFNLSATSGAAVTASASGKCTILSNVYSAPNSIVTVRNSGGAGTCSITASQGATGNYAPAADVTKAFDYRAAATTADAPTINSISGGTNSLSVAFSAPNRDGGAPITNYKYSLNGGSYVALSPPDAVSPLEITGLTPGTTYAVTIRAVNSVGDGTVSNSVSAQVPEQPGSPTIKSISGGDGYLAVVFEPPDPLPSNSITNYQYSTDGVNYRPLSPTSTSSPIIISSLSSDGSTALTNGVTYPVSLKAVNSVGASSASNTVSASPTATPNVTSPLAPTFALSTNNQDPGDFSISGFSSSATLNVSIGFVDPPSGVTFALPTTTGLTAGYGYNFTGGKTQISFTGSMANANQALAAMTVSTGSSSGTITIRVTVYENQANLYYNPINGHYYKVISRANTFANSANTSSSAIHLAETAELFGVKGYLATITSAQEQKFIYDNVNGTDIWIGASDDKELLNERAATNFANQTAAEGKWYWVAGPEAGTQFWQGATTSGLWINSSTSATQSTTSGNVSTSRYENWCTGNTTPYTLTHGRSMSEPNDAGSGEHYILEKWNGATCWNDYGVKDGSAKSYYLVEFSENWGTGSSGWNQSRGTFTSTANNPIATASVSALADNSPRSVVATAGLGSAVITWLAPLSGTVTSYTVTSSPGSLTCTTSALTCTITGLTAGTSYTFTVTATFNDSSTKNSLASAAVTPTGSNSNSGGGSGGSSPVASPTVTPTPTPTPTTRTTPRAPQILTGPVNTGTRPSQAPPEPQALIGGVPTNTTSRVVDQSKLNILAGALSLDVQVQQNQGTIKTSNDGKTELEVRKGSSTTITGSGVRPLSTVQVFLPLQGTNARELARIPVTGSGTFNGQAVFANPTQGAPLPIGQQVLQIVSVDPGGRQAVVEMKVNISQPAPAPEPNRQAGELPDLNPGQSIATEAGVPVPVTVEAIEQQRQALIQGDTWSMSINVPNANGQVTKTNGGALLKFIQNESVFIEGDGFLPGTRADVWLFSDPTLLGTVEIDENGNFSGQIAVDGKFVPIGEHTLQVQGVGDDGYVRSANLGVVVEANPISPTSITNSIWVYALLGVGLLGTWWFFVVARRRKKDAKHS